MQQVGVSKVPRRSGGKSSRIVRTGNITNSIVVIGDNNRLSLNNEGNALINRLASNQRPKIKRRTAPIILGRPLHPIGLLDRDLEKNTVYGAMRAGNCFEFYSEEGMGKTILVRYLSSQLQMPDGMVFIDRSRPLDDLLQELFDAFYHSDQLYKPSLVEYKRRFENIQALILLDNFNLTREDTQVLLSSLPNCVFVLASNERHLWGQGNVIHLAGLPLNDAIALFQQQIGRQLSRGEMSVVKSICTAVQGHPLKVIQTAALVHDEGKSLQEVARYIPGAETREWILEQAVANLSDGAKSILALLAVFRNAPLPAEHINQILQNAGLGPLLKNLLNRGLVKAHSPSYSLTGNLASYLTRNWNLSQWNDAALRHFANWTAGSPSNEQILDSAEALMATLENAAALNRWQDVLQIGVAIEPSFVIGRRWGVWERLLRLLTRAGQALGERAIEAWVLHQLGSRALCLGNLQEAKVLLSRALEIRRAIGDHSGASATQSNLSHLGGGSPTSSRGGPSGQNWIIPLIGVVIIAGIIAISKIGPSSPPLPPGFYTHTSTATVTPSVTPSRTPTRTKTPSVTPSHTITPSITATYTFTPSITITLTPTFTGSPPPPIPILNFNVNLPPEQIILYQGPEKWNAYFEVPVNINIANPGPLDVYGLAVSVRFESFDGNHPAAFRLWNENYYKDRVYLDSVSRGERGFRVYVLVPKTYNGKAVRIIAEADQCNNSINCSAKKTRVNIPNVIYDFIGEARAAKWFGYDPNVCDPDGCREKYYPLNFDGPVSDLGSARLDSGLVLEDGSQPYFVLATHPTWVKDGKITGLYDLKNIDLREGDQLIAKGGFVGGGAGDGVTFKVLTRIGYSFSPVDGYTPLVHYGPKSHMRYLLPPLQPSPPDLINIHDTNNGTLWSDEKYLPTFVTTGGYRSFFWIVDAGSTSAQDWAVWIAAYIVRP